MRKENPCLDRGCEALCCQSNLLSLTEKEYRIFTEGLDLKVEEVSFDNIKMFSALNGVGTNQGLFHSKNGEMHQLLFFNMSCSRLNKYRECSIYKNRPKGCLDLEVDSKRCKKIRLG